MPQNLTPPSDAERVNPEAAAAADLARKLDDLMRLPVRPPVVPAAEAVPTPAIDR